MCSFFKCANCMTAQREQSRLIRDIPKKYSVSSKSLRLYLEATYCPLTEDIQTYIKSVPACCLLLIKRWTEKTIECLPWLVSSIFSFSRWKQVKFWLRCKKGLLMVQNSLICIWFAKIIYLHVRMLLKYIDRKLQIIDAKQDGQQNESGSYKLPMEHNAAILNSSET